MKLLSVMAATAVAAAVAAALTIPAGADQSSDPPDPVATQIATCLHAHGAADAPGGSDALGLKQWLATHSDDPAVGVCAPQSKSPAGLVACLRSHGLNPPDNLFLLKPWMSQQNDSAAGKAALQACGVDFSAPQKDQSGADLATCLRSHGADLPAGLDGPALKQWIGAHAGDASVSAALKACAGGAPDDKAAGAKAAAGADCGGGGTAAPAPKAAPTASPDAATTQ